MGRRRGGGGGGGTAQKNETTDHSIHTKEYNLSGVQSYFDKRIFIDPEISSQIIAALMSNRGVCPRTRPCYICRSAIVTRRRLSKVL